RNWVRCKPVGPRRWKGGGWESESLRVFNTRQESGNGTRELRNRSDLCLNVGPGSETGSRSPGGSYLGMGGVCLALSYGAHTRACERLGRVGRDICRLNLVVVVELVERDARLAHEIYQRHGKEPESDDKEQSNRVLMPHVIECAHECHYHQHRRYDCAHCGEQ